MGTGEFNAGGNPAMEQHPIQWGVEILLVASRYRNRDKLRPDKPLGLYVDFTYLLLQITCSHTGHLVNQGPEPETLYNNYAKLILIISRQRQQRPSKLNGWLKSLQLFQCPPIQLNHIIKQFFCGQKGGAVASWFVRSFPERAVRVRALAEDTVLCLPKNYSYACPLYYNHRKVYIIVKQIKCRFRRNNCFERFDLMVSARKPSNAKRTLFVKLNYLASCSQIRPTICTMSIIINSLEARKST